MRGGDERIGKLRDTVSILSPTRCEDGDTGELLTSWVTADGGIPASVTTKQTEVQRGNKMTRVTTHDVVIRYRSDLEGQTTHRLLVDGQTCEITSAIDPTRRRRWLRITAIEAQ